MASAVGFAVIAVSQGELIHQRLTGNMKHEARGEPGPDVRGRLESSGCLKSLSAPDSLFPVLSCPVNIFYVFEES